MIAFKKSVILIFFGGLIVFLVLTSNLKETEVESELRVSGSELKSLVSYWQTEIIDLGPEVAYSQFKDTIDTAVADEHTQAHVFGEALYKTNGLDGIKYCDSDFEFGCYHSFFGLAVYHEGISVLPVFDQACKDQYGEANLPCQHGIGHGVLVYTGYDHLSEALELCETISWQSTGGCSSGVFMEFNFHTMGTVESGEYLREKSDDINYPCSTLVERYQPSCYFEQVQWWQNIFHNDYRQIGELCNELPFGGANYEACFYGVGNYVAAFANYEIDTIVDKCNLMPDLTSKTYCYEGASWLVRGLSSLEDAEQLCAILPDQNSQDCLSKL